VTRGKNSGPAGSADEPPFDSVQSPINELFEAATGEHPREKDEAFARILEALPGPLAAGQERALRREIEDVAFCYRAFGGRETMPSSIVAGRLEAVAKAADRICNSLGYQCRPDPEQAADPSGAVSHHIPTELRMSLMGRARAMAEEVGGWRDSDLQPSLVPDLRAGAEGPMTTEWYEDVKLDRAIEGVVLLAIWAEQAAALQNELVKRSEKGRRRSKGTEAARREPDHDLDDAIWYIACHYERVTGTRPTYHRPRDTGSPDGPFIRFTMAALAYLGQPLGPEAVAKRWRAVRKREKALREREDAALATPPWPGPEGDV